MAEEVINVYDTAANTVISGSSTLADANFSTSSTATETEYDNSTENWVRGLAVLSCSFATAPDDQSTVELLMFEQDIDGTNDQDGPAATDIQGATPVGTFKLHNVTTQQYYPCRINLEGVKKAKFSIQNNGGQTMDSDFTVKILGFSFKPN